MTQFDNYSEDITSLNLYDKIHDLYKQYDEVIDKEEVAQILTDINQIELTTYIFRREMTLYSTLFIVISGVFVLLIMLVLLTLITRPLNRLQAGTKKIAEGDLSIRIKESRFSPINGLIISFNNMVNELEINRDKLIQAEKDMMWREMAQVMAHEIKNPLTPLRLSAERMEMKYLSGSENFDKIFNDSMEVINEEINNLQRLVKEFSKFARMPTANYEDYDLNQQIREIIPPYRDEADITLSLTNDIPLFHGDKLQMKQVFVNLIQNAIQAMTTRGSIEISTKFDNETFIISIKDSGAGIPPEDMNRIFRPYFTTKEKGTGLGLSIVKRMIDQHDGSIDVLSKQDEGTTFMIRIKRNKKDKINDENFSS
ncbi:MAG TPA: HAMP domain-containing sensor histidine kinase [Candidatus Cloacimonetes bacterium]|nr:HAMP domain-containing sensor histidine kinase [Candidatus Cloacimonadota bacterium]HEX37826.1 HAMP domain-containing sensor histidine kinase [Candidatus Cloacimonadota bacterium]